MEGEGVMAFDNGARAYQQPPEPDPDLNISK